MMKKVVNLTTIKFVKNLQKSLTFTLLTIRIIIHVTIIVINFYSNSEEEVLVI